MSHDSHPDSSSPKHASSSKHASADEPEPADDPKRHLFPPEPAAHTVARQAGLLVIELVIIGLGLLIAIDHRREHLVRYLWIYVVIAAAYLIGGAILLRRASLPSEMLGAHRSRNPIVRFMAVMRYSQVFSIACSITGLAAGIVVVIDGGRDNPELTYLGAATIVLSWMLLHAGYARAYAGLFYRHGGGLDFPGTKRPAPLDFGYFSYTLGTSFAVSDVTAVGHLFRYPILTHSVASFFYNSIVLGVALSVLTGS